MAQAAQITSLPDLDHARHFSAVSAEVPAAVIAKATSSGLYDLVRPLFYDERCTKAVLTPRLRCEEVCAAAGAPGVDDGTRDLDKIRRIRQGKRCF